MPAVHSDNSVIRVSSLIYARERKRLSSRLIEYYLHLQRERNSAVLISVGTLDPTNYSKWIGKEYGSGEPGEIYYFITFTLIEAS